MKERYENIREMNEILLKIESILTKAEEVLDEWKAVQPDYDRLVAYYDSKQWRKDYFDSNDGKIPDEVPQWCLPKMLFLMLSALRFLLLMNFKNL